MAINTKSQFIIPEIFANAVEAAYKGKNAFLGSTAASLGLVNLNGSFPGVQIGETVSVPYFSTLGEFTDRADGAASPIRRISQAKELNTVQASSLAFDLTSWANSGLGDPYQEGVRQITEAATRRMDRAIIDAAVATNTNLATGQKNLVLDAYSASTPRLLDYDLLVDGKMMFEDDQDDIAAMIMHSRVMAQLMKLRDADGKPMFIDWQNGGIVRVFGIPTIVSDRLPLSSAVMGAVTETGTTPPDLTLGGTATQFVDLVVRCTKAGALGTSEVIWSVNGGKTFTKSATVTAGSSTPIAITDPDTGSPTGLTMSFENASAAVNNVWTARLSAASAQTLLVKRGAFAFWYNQSKLQDLQSVLIPQEDAYTYAVHLYFVAHRYNSLRGSHLPGVVTIRHNL